MTTEDFIKENYKTVPIVTMAKHLDISCSTVRRLMKANYWQSPDSRCKEIFEPPVEGIFNWDWAKKQDFILLNS